MRFSAGTFNTSEDFFTYLRDTFDILYAEGEAGSPKMMSVGLHCRLVGRPGRIKGLADFLDYIQPSPTSGSPPAATSPPTGAPATPPPPSPTARPPSPKDAFVARFGGVFEHSPWIAERAFDLELGPAHDTATGLASALPAPSAPPPRTSASASSRPTPTSPASWRPPSASPPKSTAEQAGAGLDALTDAERARFTELNDAYQAKFGFPFIIAVRGLDKARILQAFETRVANDRDQELATACAQVERIALLRLKDMLP